MRRKSQPRSTAAPKEPVFPSLLDLLPGADARAALDAAREHSAVAAAFETARAEGPRAIAEHHGRVGALVARSLAAVS